MTTTTILDGCDAEIPVGEVARVFDFGQFIELYDSGAGPGGIPQPIVIDPKGNLPATKFALTSNVGKKTESQRLGGRSLQSLLSRAQETPELEIADLDEAQRSGILIAGTTKYKFSLTTAQLAALRDGGETLADLVPLDGVSAQHVKLRLAVTEVQLDEKDVANVLASHSVQVNNTAQPVKLTDASIQQLLSGKPVDVLTLTGTNAIRNRLRILPKADDPAPGVVEINDLARFLASPSVPDAKGRLATLKLSADAIMALRKEGKATVGQVNLTLDENQLKLIELLKTKTAPEQQLRSISDLVAQRVPEKRGISVAVMVPWRQEWKLVGFSRGTLLSSLALTPQEEVVVELRSWEHRTKSLEQSSETDTEQSFESSYTTKDADEAFDELTTSHDFTWQAGGSLDVSYSPGVASVAVHADASVENAENVKNVARTTAQRAREATTKAAAKVRSRRVTRIFETVETGSENRVTRRIRNANLTRTLTFDFFETLAHYDVTLNFQADKLSLVALIDNPELRRPGDFTADLVRQNETTFRNALLESALVDGFAALRFLAAYDAAKKIVDDQNKAKKEAKSLLNVVTPATSQPSPLPDPAAAQQEAAMAVLLQIHSSAKTVRASANIDTALRQIEKQDEDDRRPINEEERRNGQYWMFVQCLAARFPAILDGLLKLSSVDTPVIADAQQLASLLPGQGAAKPLSSIFEMTAEEKEEAGLQREIDEYADWLEDGWWKKRCREESLYTPNDAGIVSLCDKLFQALQTWEAKKTEGALARDKDVASKEAGTKQDEAMTEDKIAMAFPLEEHARAVERATALLAHISQHPYHYSYALFLALTPAEQVGRILEGSGGQLQVGLFEPRVVAMTGRKLAVPLTSLAASGLSTFLTSLREQLTDALQNVSATPETVILPTPGVNMTSRLGRCTAAEEFIEESRKADLELSRARAKQAQAEAESAAAEVERRKARLSAKDYAPFTSEESGARVG